MFGYDYYMNGFHDDQQFVLYVHAMCCIGFENAERALLVLVSFVGW